MLLFFFDSVPNATANASLYQCCSGFCIDMLKILSEKIGFEYDLFEVEDRKFGAFDRVSSCSSVLQFPRIDYSHDIYCSAQVWRFGRLT